MTAGDRIEVRVGHGVETLDLGPRTRLLGVLGSPIAHSLSPVFQQAALDARGIDARYLRWEVPLAGLDGAVQELRRLAAAGRLAGANVTHPLKQAIVPRLDGVDAAASQAGAVNTLWVETSREPRGTPRLCGTNTDMDGIRGALGEHGRELRGAGVLVLGAGGAARAAVAAALCDGARRVRVAHRDPARARAMLEAVAAAVPGSTTALDVARLGDPGASPAADDDILVQATPVGMSPQDAPLVDLDHAAARLFVLETIYAPRETLLLRQARSRGLAGTNGLPMLLHQGAAAFARWYGDPPLDVMRRALERASAR